MPLGLEQRQIIGRIHLRHLGVQRARARQQPHLRRALDHVIIGNQITVLREEHRAGVAY